MDVRSCPLAEEQASIRDEQRSMREAIQELRDVASELRIAVGILSERLEPIRRGFWGSVVLVFGLLGAAVMSFIIRKP